MKPVPIRGQPWAERQLKKAAEVYDLIFETTAGVVFNEYVKPFCDWNHLVFRCGMGTWAFMNDRGDQIELPTVRGGTAMTELLSVSDRHGRPLTEEMEDYVPPEIKNAPLK